MKDSDPRETRVCLGLPSSLPKEGSRLHHKEGLSWAFVPYGRWRCESGWFWYWLLFPQPTSPKGSFTSFPLIFPWLVESLEEKLASVWEPFMSVSWGGVSHLYPHWAFSNSFNSSKYIFSAAEMLFKAVYTRSAMLDLTLGTHVCRLCSAFPVFWYLRTAVRFQSIQLSSCPKSGNWAQSSPDIPELNMKSTKLTTTKTNKQTFFHSFSCHLFPTNLGKLTWLVLLSL